MSLRSCPPNRASREQPALIVRRRDAPAPSRPSEPSVATTADHPALVEPLGAMLVEGASVDAMLDALDGSLAALTLGQTGLLRLAARGELWARLEWGGRALARLDRLPPELVHAGVAGDEQPLVLSRFATLAVEHEALVLRSPLALGPLVLCDPELGLAVVAALRRPTTSMAIAARLGDGAGALAAVVRRAGFTAVPGQEDDDPDLASWEPHDLAFHRRSRMGPHGGGIGPTRRLEGRIAPALSHRPSEDGPNVELCRPELPLTMPLGQVLSERRSRRAHIDAPLQRDDLGALLHHAARVTRVGATDAGVERTWRPYPSAGACYPLELYLAVDRCVGLTRGLYRYDPYGHALTPVAEAGARLQRLLADATIGPGTPPVAISIAARFRRTTWKYESIAYALILKDAGVLLQTLHLVATAMGLASCIVGTGDPERLAGAIGLPAHVESSVGELILGAPASRARCDAG